MAVSRKGSRNITVDDEEFSWKISRDKEYIHLVVVYKGTQGRRLLVQFKEEDRKGDKNSPGKDIAIGPGLIAKLIRYARSQGWNFREPGKDAFKLNHSEIKDLL
ncbi:MAG: hypothetical protein GY754_06240 [bacterium]|nr:hypothetical protein [bacterium]